MNEDTGDNPTEMVDSGICHCRQCYCQEHDPECVVPGHDVCGCCMADCPDVHPWHNIGAISWDANITEPPSGWHVGKEITEQNAFLLGPVPKPGQHVGPRFDGQLEKTQE